MPASNGTAVDIARLQERAERNQSELQDLKEWVGEVTTDVKEVKDVQNQTLIVLQKMETSLEHMNEKLVEHDSHDEKLQVSVETLQHAHIKTATKFKLVLAILGVIGTAMVGVAVKLLFFSPSLSIVAGS